jgi:outer membrane beta-barrel protein
MRFIQVCSILGCVGLGLVSTSTPARAEGPAARAEGPAVEALDRSQAGVHPKPAVENRFFLKESRFEISPLFGYVPNNPFARRYMAGGILGYHFSEALSAQAEVLYSPDNGENDLKPLVEVLLDRAANSGPGTVPTGTAVPTEFQQPLDKAILSAAFGPAWAPFYGKINLVGETVLSFDFYVFGGVGMVSKVNYIATYDENQTDGNFVELTSKGNEVKVSFYAGVGQNYFVNQFMAVKIDIRGMFYVDNAPQYDPNVPETGSRLYNNVIASAGLAFFFPKMKPRLYDF